MQIGAQLYIFKHCEAFRRAPKATLASLAAAGYQSLEVMIGLPEEPGVCADTGLPHLAAVMVEQDPTTPTPLADMLTSRAYLKTHFGL